MKRLVLALLLGAVLYGLVQPDILAGLQNAGERVNMSALWHFGIMTTLGAFVAYAPLTFLAAFNGVFNRPPAA